MIKRGILYLLEKPEVNSRFIFLLTGIITAIAILALTIGFIFGKDRGDYPAMIAAVGGVGGIGVAVGRAATKWAGIPDAAPEEKTETKDSK